MSRKFYTISEECNAIQCMGCMDQTAFLKRNIEFLLSERLKFTFCGAGLGYLDPGNAIYNQNQVGSLIKSVNWTTVPKSEMSQK